MDRIPQESSALEAEGIPDYADPDSGPHGQLSIEPPHDTPLGVEGWGLTAREHHDGEPLAGRLAREEPEVLARADEPYVDTPVSDTPFSEGAGGGVGRLAAPGEPLFSEFMVAFDLGNDLGGFSAEEAAMHLVIEP